MHLDVLVIAPHPDDAELGMGGAILKFKAEGVRVGVLDLTDGEPTPHGSPEIRTRETAAATEILGLDWRDNLGLPNRRLEATLEGVPALGAGREGGVDRLQGDGASEGGVVGLVDDAHHPPSELAPDLVASDLLGKIDHITAPRPAHCRKRARKPPGGRLATARQSTHMVAGMRGWLEMMQITDPKTDDSESGPPPRVLLYKDLRRVPGA